MKKTLPIFILSFLLISAPVIFAAPKENNHNYDKEKNNEKRELISSGVSLSPSIACDPANNWKNHGAYVSCVAHEHEGGDKVSAAAHSKIGKKQDIDDIDPSGTPDNDPSVSPSDIPSIEPSVSPSPSDSITIPREQLQSLITLFERALNFLKHLL